MRLPDTFHSTPFRIGVAYAVVFSISAAVLFGVLFWSATREMTSALRAAIEQDALPLA